MTSSSRRAALAALLAMCPLLGSVALGASRPSAAASGDRIIISGAAGHLGELTVQALLARGVPADRLILVSRTPERLARYASLGASVRYGDFTKPETLRRAFEGGTRMLLISIGLDSGPRPLAHQHAIDAAIADGVRQIAYTSFVALSRGDTSGLGADHYRTEEILKKSGVAWTMLRNSIYMEELIPQAARMLAQGRATVPAHEDRIGYVAREDCAQAAAAVLTTPGHENKVYDITGPELIGTRELAAAVTRISGKPIRLIPADPGAAARRAFGGPALSVTTSAVAQLTGRPATSLDTFLEQHREELLGGNASATAADPESAAAVISRLRLIEAPNPVRLRAGWHPPRKIVLLAFNPEFASESAALASAVPAAQLVLARNRTAAIAAVSDADVLIGFNPEICDPAIIDAAGQLRWIQSLAAGVENCVALPSVRNRDILITNMRGVDSAAIAEHAIALTLALAHGLDVFMVDTAKRQWSRKDGATTPIRTLAGKTMLVVGLGGIGTDVAQRAHALGMQVVATREHGHEGPDFVRYVGEPGELLTLARNADVIVNTSPLTPQTRGLFNAAFFAVVKPTAIFINVARGASVVTADLVNALDEHRLAGAGLDVVDPEPLPPDHPLWGAPHVIVSPHISGRSDLPGLDRWVVARENLRRYAAGERMLSVVDLRLGY
ncbi:MAG TPA: NAD(P)-dependent oxidoreductase [Steroidobacteraceae bacterium]|nr:NAD(P)-dependent oxidoreductase [Steroidobacteraceae bacterium]